MTGGIRNYITGLWNFYLIQPIGIDLDLQRGKRMPAFNSLSFDLNDHFFCRPKLRF